jgi:hypothetical protein
MICNARRERAKAHYSDGSFFSAKLKSERSSFAFPISLFLNEIIRNEDFSSKRKKKKS